MDKKLTEDQLSALSELRFMLKNSEDIPSSVYDDNQLLKRFLIAREFHAKKAESMIRKNLRWQKEFQFEHIVTDFDVPEVLAKYFPLNFLGYDKEGIPILYCELGRLDEKGMLKSINPIHLRKLIIKECERHLRNFKSDGSGRSPQLLFIFDVAQLTLTRFLHKRILPVVMKIFTEFQDNYPERIKNLFLINAPPGFAAVWSVVREWLGSSLIRKIEFCEGGTYKETLRQKIDDDVLPAFLGGKKTDPDGNPQCYKTMIRAVTVPEDYYTELNPEEFLQNPGATAARIGRQKELLVPFQVMNPDCILNWEFIVLHSYDIGFGLSLKNADYTFEELIPVHKVETACIADFGKYRCKSKGNYFFVFDNSYSWIHAKEICYRIWTTSAY